MLEASSLTQHLASKRENGYFLRIEYNEVQQMFRSADMVSKYHF
jgi:hypothetical protein